MFALSQVPKDMGLDNTVDERTRELTQFIRKIDAIPGGIYGSDTEMINDLSTTAKVTKVQRKRCVFYFSKTTSFLFYLSTLHILFLFSLF